jgi:hypothetical protein
MMNLSSQLILMIVISSHHMQNRDLSQFLRTQDSHQHVSSHTLSQMYLQNMEAKIMAGIVSNHLNSLLRHLVNKKGVNMTNLGNKTQRRRKKKKKETNQNHSLISTTQMEEQDQMQI